MSINTKNNARSTTLVDAVQTTAGSIPMTHSLTGTGDTCDGLPAVGEQCIGFFSADIVACRRLQAMHNAAVILCHVARFNFASGLHNKWLSVSGHRSIPLVLPTCGYKWIISISRWPCRNTSIFYSPLINFQVYPVFTPSCTSVQEYVVATPGFPCANGAGSAASSSKWSYGRL